ncbi:MAG: FHA domain-containing protein [Planctomycetes bacterium]|nr:FHA domain-containing protein [Planctomycetota bacterium]
MTHVFKLHVYSEDRAIDKRVEVQGDVATIGRGHKDEPVDVTIPRKDVSRVHVRLFKGLVVDDLGSTNGTYVDGQRIQAAVALQGRSFQIGDPALNNLVTVEIEPDSDPGFALAGAGGQETLVDASALGSAELTREREALLERAEAYREDAERLRDDAERLERELAAARAELAAQPAQDELVTTNRRLEQRIGELKRQIEEREQSDAQSLQARLALDELAAVRARAEEAEAALHTERQRARGAQADAEQARAAMRELERRASTAESELGALRAEAERAQGDGGAAQSAAEELQRLRDELRATQARADAAAPKPALFMSKLVERLEKEKRELEAQVQRLSAGAGAGAGSSAQLFSDLRQENEALKRQLDELRRGARPSSAPDATLAVEAASLRAEVERLRLANDQLRAKRQSDPPSSRPAATQVGLLRRLLDSDPTLHGSNLAVPADEFLITEQYVCFRRVEKVITRAAAEFLQIYNDNTFLPGTDGANYRRQAAAVLDAPTDEEARRELARYMELIAKWLGASVQAYRRAASRFVDELRGELSEAGLTKGKPVGGLGLAWGVKAELWDRSQAHLRQLSSTSIEERMEKLAREEASSIVHTGSTPES